MRISKVACVLAITIAVAGCSQMRPKRVAQPDPTLLPPSVNGDSVVIEAPVARPVTVADRHPLFRRPREYYDKTNGNKLSKTAAAAVIGVPSGIGAEFKQIFVGQPAVN